MTPLAVVFEVGRRGGPRVIEAMVVPAVLFYVALVAFGVGAAYGSALGWSYLAVGVRGVTRRRVPGLLLLASVGLTARTLLAVVTDSTAVYFLQPVAGSVVLASIFVGSVLFGQPLIGRLADDFCPMDADAAGRSGVLRLFRRLTYLWAAVILLKGGTTLTLLLTLPISEFVLIRTFALWALTVSAVVLTFAWSFRTVDAEQLVPVFANAGMSQRFVVTSVCNVSLP
jgi:intracellular septation protein A